MMNISDINEIMINASKLKYCDEMIIRLDYNTYIIINAVMALILFLNMRIKFFGRIMKSIGVGFTDDDFDRSMSMYILFYNIFVFSIQFLLEPVVYVIKGG